MFAAGRDQGKPWKLTAGARYRVPEHVELWTGGDFNGAQLLSSNGGQKEGAFILRPLPENVETLALEDVNQWLPDLAKDTDTIPDLRAQKGWTYTITTKQAELIRDGGSVIEKQCSFTVMDDEGRIDPPLLHRFDRLEKPATVVRQRSAEPVTIRNLDVRLVEGNEPRSRIVETWRSNTIFDNGFVANRTDQQCLQGCCVLNSVDILWRKVHVEGLKAVKTNYAFSSGRSARLTYEHCSETGNRRGLDGSSSQILHVIGGDYADGVGYHWGRGLRFSDMPTIGNAGYNNPNCIAVSGADISGAAEFVLTQPGASVLLMRPDIPVLTGTIDLDGSTVLIKAEPQSAEIDDWVGINCAAIRDHYDSKAPAMMPGTIRFNVTLSLEGPLEKPFSALLIDSGRPAESFPEPVIYGKTIDIGLTFKNFPDLTTKKQISVTVVCLKSQTARGGEDPDKGYDIHIASPVLKLFADANAHAETRYARHDIFLSRLERPVVADIHYGGVKDLDVDIMPPGSRISRKGGSNLPALGNEILRIGGKVTRG